MSEFQDETETDASGQLEIVYPCVKHNTINYAANIKKAIEQSPYYGIGLYTKVINNMRNPMIRLLIINELFDKIICSYSLEPIAMKKCAKWLRKYKEFVSDNSSSQGGLGALQSSSTSSLSSIFEKYLVLDKRRRRSKFSEISREQYMALYLVALQSYLEVYRIHDFHKSYKNNEEWDDTMSDADEEEMGSPDFCEKIDYDALELNIEMSEAGVDMKEEITVNAPKRKRFRYVSIKAERYEFIRDEIKFYLNILDDTNTLHTKYPDLFQELKAFVDRLKNFEPMC